MKKEISIIIATLNEENNVNILFDKIKNLLKKDFFWEVIFVDDGSQDKTLDQIKNIRNENNNVFLISSGRFSIIAFLPDGPIISPSNKIFII